MAEQKVFYPTFISNYDEAEEFLDGMSAKGFALVEYYRGIYTFTESRYRRKYVFFDFPYRDKIKSDENIRWSISELKIPSKKWKISSSNRRIYEIKSDSDAIALQELKNKRNTIGLRILKNHLGISLFLFSGFLILFIMCLMDDRLRNLTLPYMIGIVAGLAIALTYIIFTVVQIVKLHGNVIKRLRTGIKSDIIKKKHGRKTE